MQVRFGVKTVYDDDRKSVASPEKHLTGYDSDTMLNKIMWKKFELGLNFYVLLSYLLGWFKYHGQDYK